MNPHRSATPAQILEIRRLARTGQLSPRAWAAELGCSVETIRRYARGDTARSVGLAPEVPQPPIRSAPATNDLGPSDDELAASIARLSASLEPAREAAGLLEELTRKGREER